MNHFFFLLLPLLFVASGEPERPAVSDAPSRALLSAVAEEYRLFTSFSADITVEMVVAEGTEPRVFQGRALYKGNKYRITLPETDLFCDGVKIYQYLPEVKEVNISLVSQSSGDFQIMSSSPMELIAVYDKEFVAAFVQDVRESGRELAEIDLWPVNGNNADFKRLRVRIDRQAQHIDSISAFLSNGFRYHVVFRNILVNLPLADREFVFRPSDYPGVEVIDLTY